MKSLEWLGGLLTSGSILLFMAGGILTAASGLWPLGASLVGGAFAAQVLRGFLGAGRGAYQPIGAAKEPLPAMAPPVVEPVATGAPVALPDALPVGAAQHLNTLSEDGKAGENLGQVRTLVDELTSVVNRLSTNGRMDSEEAKLFLTAGYRSLRGALVWLGGIGRPDDQPVSAYEQSRWDPALLLLLEYAKPGDRVYISSYVQFRDFWPTLDGWMYQEAIRRASESGVDVRLIFLAGEGFGACRDLQELVRWLRGNRVQVRFASPREVGEKERRDAVALYRRNGRKELDLVTYLRMSLCPDYGFATYVWLPAKSQVKEKASRLPRLWEKAFESPPSPVPPAPA